MTRLTAFAALSLLVLVVFAVPARAADWVEVIVTNSDLDAEAIASHERQARALAEEAAQAADPAEKARLYKASGEAWADAHALRSDDEPNTRLRVVHAAPGSARAKAVAWLRANPTKRGGAYYVYAKEGRFGISRKAPGAAPQRTSGLFSRPVGGVPVMDSHEEPGGSATYPEEELRRLARKDAYMRKQEERRRARVERRRQQQARVAQERHERRVREHRRRQARERLRKLRLREARRREARERQQAALRARMRAVREANARALRERFRKQRAIRVGDTSAASRANGTLFR